MGAGASRSPATGVPANPRAVYTDTRARREKQTLQLDSPVLVDVQHGSVRYRYNRNDKNRSSVLKRKEQPHEGENNVQKMDYFYHPRLQVFGKDASYENETNWKFYYVTKGPIKAHQKKVFYVFGKGNMAAEDGKVTRPSEVKGDNQEFTWPSEYKLSRPLDAFYSLTFSEGEVEFFSGEDILFEDLDSTPDKSSLDLTLKSCDLTEDLKRRVAVKILKAAGNIHIYVKGKKLRDEDVVGDFRLEENRDKNLFKVNLTLMT